MLITALEKIFCKKKKENEFPTNLPADQEHEFPGIVSCSNDLVRLQPLVKTPWLPLVLPLGLLVLPFLSPPLPLAGVGLLKSLNQVRAVQVLHRLPGALLLWVVVPLQQVFWLASSTLLYDGLKPTIWSATYAAHQLTRLSSTFSTDHSSSTGSLEGGLLPSSSAILVNLCLSETMLDYKNLRCQEKTACRFKRNINCCQLFRKKVE